MVCKGNISLIMIFVLLIGSILGLMSTTMLQSMINETSLLRETYQSYYNAKAGIELGNLAVARYDYGYSDQLTGSSAIIANNLLSRQWNDASLELTIDSHSADADDNTEIMIGSAGKIDFCENTNAITLIPGWSWIMPLYADNRTLLGGQISHEYYSNMINDNFELSLTTPPQSDLTKKMNYSILLWEDIQHLYDTQDSDKQQNLAGKWTLDDIINNKKIQKFLVPSSTAIGWYTPEQSLLSLLRSPSTFGGSGDYFNYLTLTNTSNTDISFCLILRSRPEWYTTDTSLVTSIGRYKNTSLWLQSTIREWLSSFVLANNAWAWEDLWSSSSSPSTE